MRNREDIRRERSESRAAREIEIRARETERYQSIEGRLGRDRDKFEGKQKRSDINQHFF